MVIFHSYVKLPEGTRLQPSRMDVAGMTPLLGAPTAKPQAMSVLHIGERPQTSPTARPNRSAQPPSGTFHWKIAQLATFDPSCLHMNITNDFPILISLKSQFFIRSP